MSAAGSWITAVVASACVLGLSVPAMANEVTEYCQTSLKSDPTAKDFPDVAKFCGCIGEKVPAADRAISVTVMKASDEAKAKSTPLDTSKLPPDQAKALDALRTVVPGCMALVMPAPKPAPTPAPAPTATPAPATPGKVTGVAAWAVLVGNTVSGKIDGKDYAEFYLADGTVKTMQESELTTGKWSLEGDKVCFVYPKDDKECFTVEVAGDDVSFIDKSGTGVRLKLLKGNPKNL